MKKTLFKDLKIGERFRFESEVSMPGSGMKTGVAVKMTSRFYEYEDGAMRCQVGSINALVIRVMYPSNDRGV